MVGSVPLSTAIGAYPHTRALFDGRVSSNLLSLQFADIKPISRAFAPMVREVRFDVSEMAIATFLQAKAWGKPLVLLPVVLASRFQEGALLCRADSFVAGPADLAGRRVGVRAYSQTTGMWLRGILSDTYGVQAEDIHWVTFEDAHVEEYRDPPWAERAAPGQDLLQMLRDGRLDAVIVGNEVPTDPAFRTVFPDPAKAGRDFMARHRFEPVNHLLTVRRELANRQPEFVGELARMFHRAAELAEKNPQFPVTREALGPAISLALRYSAEQGLLPAPFSLSAMWEGLPTEIW